MNRNGSVWKTPLQITNWLKIEMKNKEKATSRVPEIATDISCECASISPDMLKCDITDYLCHFSPTWSMKERLIEYVFDYCPRGEGNRSGEDNIRKLHQ